ncbi:MAG TPA: zf-HC2 domain-containing protein [Thermoanaerobaculaceae bacterium]|nr:zf-HC2 domain-containing protein [Thermoanaerobaculaceae bacterium]
MNSCNALLDRLDAALAGDLPADLAEHLAGCASCQAAVERARGMSEGESVLRAVRAPAALVRRLKALPRLAPACEQALDALAAALDGEVAESDRGLLMEHMRACPACRAAWEAFATLREVGGATHAAGRLRAAVALPPRQRIELRRQRAQFFDLRLATAAAYLLAALTVFLVSNPAQVARASSEGMDRAAVYARAAVENRVSSYSERIRGSIAAAEGWARDHAMSIWNSARSLVGGAPANPKAGGHVVEDGKGGRS